MGTGSPYPPLQHPLKNILNPLPRNTKPANPLYKTAFLRIFKKPQIGAGQQKTGESGL